jgi:hypothetical protein
MLLGSISDLGSAQNPQKIAIVIKPSNMFFHLLKRRKHEPQMNSQKTFRLCTKENAEFLLA